MKKKKFQNIKQGLHQDFFSKFIPVTLFINGAHVCFVINDHHHRKKKKEDLIVFGN